ncbi:MAG: pyridoxine 5'-phosphate synthase [Nitrospinota bacterium]
MAVLSVNVDHVATVRQARRTYEPDPVSAALIAELSGARGITIHLRQDRRHIQDRDLRLLKELITTKLNLEMRRAEEMEKIALELKPTQVSLVPERAEEVTTEGGLDVVGGKRELAAFIPRLKEAGIIVSIFVDPLEAQIRASREVGADAIEINTAKYAEARAPRAREESLVEVVSSAELAADLGLKVHAGHGLNYLNVEAVAAIPVVEELNIGHSIVSRSIFAGFAEAVREMASLIREASRRGGGATGETGR